MAIPSEKIQERLKTIKDNVRAAYDDFKDNNKRFHYFRNLTYVSSLNAQNAELLDLLKRPKIEFNIMSSFISRLMGEFSKYDPDIEASANDVQPVDPRVIKFIEGHIRYIMQDNTDNNWKKKGMQDTLSGGFTVWKIYTDYENPMSFKQKILIKRVFEPTMCGFDPLAETPHKGDGRYCYEYIIMSKDKFESKYPEVDISKLSYTKTEGNMNWSFSSESGEKNVLVMDYYEKKSKRVKIAELSNGIVIEEEKYDYFVREFRTQYAGQAPIIKDRRKTDIEYICRYRVIEDKIIEFKKTDFSYFPLIFVDGDSITIKKDTDNTSSSRISQFTKPYIYAAKGIQVLKNIAGQTLTHEMENMCQLKFKAAIESIPDQYVDAYNEPQIPSNLLYNAFKVGKDGQDVALPPPQEIPRIPIPPEVMGMFAQTDKSIQSILGSYDASLGINNNQLSGKAIVEGATQSNSAAMPFVLNFLEGLNRVAHVLVDLIPKYIVKPTILPVIDEHGKKQSVNVNSDNDSESPRLNYAAHALNVRVKAGVSFAIQKSRALQQITLLMQASPLFAQFINQKGLPILLDNLEIRGIDLLKAEAEQFMQQMQQQQPPPDPNMLRMQLEKQKLQQQGQQDQTDNQIKGARVAIEKQLAENATAKVQSQIQDDAEKRRMQHEAHVAEVETRNMEVALEASKLMHQHAQDINKTKEK